MESKTEYRGNVWSIIIIAVIVDIALQVLATISGISNVVPGGITAIIGLGAGGYVGYRYPLFFKRPVSEEITKLKSRITTKVPIRISAGMDSVGLVQKSDKAKLYRLDDGRVIFTLDHPQYFNLTHIEYAGPTYHEEIQTTTTGTTKKKRHGLAGALIGGALTGGVGAVAGGVVGHGMGKDKTNNRSVSRTVQVEDTSELTLFLTDDTKATKSVTIYGLEKNFKKIIEMAPTTQTPAASHKNFVVNDDTANKLENLKALLDKELITEDDFEQKKKQILGL